MRRLRLLATFGRRLDSLFELQVPSLRDGGRLALLRSRVRPLAGAAQALLDAELLPALAARGAALTRWDALGETARDALDRLFLTEISPLLTPLTVDAGHPFPCVASLALNLAVLVREPDGEGLRYVGIEVPPTLARFVAAPPGPALLRVEDVIGAHLGVLLPGLEVVCHHAFRVTRDGRPRRALSGAGPSRRTRAAVRLELEAATPAPLRALLCSALGLWEDDVYPVAGSLDLCGIASLPVARVLRAAPGGLGPMRAARSSERV